MTNHCMFLQLSEGKVISFKTARLKADKLPVKLAHAATLFTEFSDGLEKSSKKKTEQLASRNRNHSLAITKQSMYPKTF